MNGRRILIVEDNLAVLRGLKDNFLAQGCKVDTAVDGESGLEAALAGAYDLMLLDLMLPKVNGYEICRAVREQGNQIPIIMITAKGQEEDIILGLNLGADDYVTKPFRIRELLARANAFLRRGKQKAAEACQFGEFTLSTDAHKLFQEGTEVPLTAKEFALLQFFLRRRGRALARNDILNAVWGHSVFVTERCVDRCVTTLRAKIEADPRRPRFIHTIRDIGYRFEDAEGLGN